MNSEKNQQEPTGKWLLSSAWTWLVVACVLVVVIGILLPRRKSPTTAEPLADPVVTASEQARKRGTTAHQRTQPEFHRWQLTPGFSAEAVVTNKVGAFARNRRDVLRRMAEKFEVPVPPECDVFFSAIEQGRWEDCQTSFKALEQMRSSEDKGRELGQLWPAILETYGVAEIAHKWPAQQLLDYGSEILGSLGPDTVYVGGTDPGRFIPTLLNETSGSESRIVLTQNAFADASYLEYVEFLYKDRLNTLGAEDSMKAFSTYMANASARLQHDTQFPDEPKQLRPGENVQATENRVSISGQVAVMAINEKLLSALMENNPTVSFAIEQSFPFTSTYPGASPAGPIMELNATRNPLTAERAVETVDYWRAASQSLLAESASAGSVEVRDAYAKLASEQASLLLARDYASEAEQTFQSALLLSPGSPEVVFRYANLLSSQNRIEEALRVANAAMLSAPNNASLRSLYESLTKLSQQ